MEENIHESLGLADIRLLIGYAFYRFELKLMTLVPWGYLLIELNHILHCLCGPPSIPLSFNLAIVLPRWITYCVNSGTEGVSPPTPSIHRLQRGLPGYLILFAPHAFAPQRQLTSSKPPSPLVFLRISTHSTATHGIPLTSPSLKRHSFQCSSKVKPWHFTSDLRPRLRALYTQ